MMDMNPMIDATLAFGGAIGVAYLTIYLFGNNGTH